MKQPSPSYFFFCHRLSGLVMVIALLWLTVSTPFVYEQQQQLKKETSQKLVANADNQSGAENGSDDTNPLGNTNEEKSETGV
ncbi:MAG TPA: hypothetical protein VM871_12320, partial [Flavisolibacter sp.]|nr:hypothetical protein [Flavisolibacter sp.]